MLGCENDFIKFSELDGFNVRDNDSGHYILHGTLYATLAGQTNFSSTGTYLTMCNIHIMKLPGNYYVI